MKLGIFVGENGNWTFFREIFEYLAQYHDTLVFRPREFSLPLLSGRLNRWAYHHGLRSILRKSDLALFEWASELLALATASPKRAPLVTRLHSFEAFVWSHRIRWQAVDQAIFVSRFTQDYVVARHPELKGRTRVIHNGVDLNRFHPPAQRTFRGSLGMLCSIEGRKRVYEAVLTLPSLVERWPSGLPGPHLHIVGAPPNPFHNDYHFAVERLVAKLGLQDRVTLHGHLPDPAPWLREIDVFISHSALEGQQVALLEAMASGCYCLSHFWGGVEEVLPPEHVYVHNEEMVDKIVDYARRPPSAQEEAQLRMRAIACEKFDLERQKREFREVIEHVAQTRG